MGVRFRLTGPGRKQEGRTRSLAQNSIESAEELAQAFGRHIWLDVPFMLVMLALGVSAHSNLGSEAQFWYPGLFTLYTSAILLNIIQGTLQIRGKRTALDKPLWRGRSLLEIGNATADMVFAVTLLLLSTKLEMTLSVILILSSIRPIELVLGRAFPNLILYGALAGAALNSFIFLLSTDSDLPLVQRTEIALVAIALLLSYLVQVRAKYKAQEENLAKVIEGARTQAEQHEDVLAGQLLRLNMLQSSITAINSAIELDKLLAMIVSNAVRVLKVEQSTIGLVDQETGDLVIRCATGIDSSELKGRRFLPGVGVAGWVVKHGKPALIKDVSIDPRYLSLNNDGYVRRSTRSMLCAPLIIGHDVIGVLCITHSEPGSLTVEDQNLLVSFAEQAALAVYKSQLLAETTRQRNTLRQREELITGLNLITQSILSSLDLPLILDTTVLHMGDLASFDHALIYLRNDKSGELQLSALGGEGPYVASLALREGMPALKWWEDPNQPRSFQGGSDGMIFLAVRLVNDNKSLGCILLARQESLPFSDGEIDAVDKLADVISIAIIKAKLFGQVVGQQQQTSSLYRLMRAVYSAHNREDLAKVVVREMKKITNARSAVLLMEDFERAQIRVWAAEGDWARKDLTQATLSLYGDPFVRDALSALISAEPLELLMLPDAPRAIKETFGNSQYITIPLANANLIYGLLVIDRQWDDQMNNETGETARLAASHCTVALERAQLFESTVRSMRQSDMLYRVAARVQGSLYRDSVVEMTLQGALSALPIYSCELYMLEKDHTMLRRYGQAVSPDLDLGVVSLGPEMISKSSSPVLAEVLRSPGLRNADLEGGLKEVTRQHLEEGEAKPEDHSDALQRPSVLLARLMGGDETIGLVRIVSSIPAEEFVRNYATFCQTLFTHTGGALERSRLYSELLESKRELEAVVLSISNGVVVTDARLNVIISNELADRVLGIAGACEQNKPLTEILSDANLVTMIQDCNTDYKATVADITIELDRELRSYEVVVQPIAGANTEQVFGTVITLRDVTAERAHEKAKSDFLSMISHELRTPLNSIYGFLDITLSGKTGALTDLQADFLSTAKQETEVLRRLISDLLDYSRLENGTLRMEMEPLDLSALVSRIIRSANARMNEDELQLINEVPKDLIVLGDSVRLQQVLDNLLDNAAKFTDPGGQIVVGCQVADEKIIISVRDNGCGIPASQIESIFDRFFQADNHSTRRKRGQGLGLAICKSIIEAHRGRIWAASTTGVGTAMYVELPLLVPGKPLAMSKHELEGVAIAF